MNVGRKLASVAATALVGGTMALAGSASPAQAADTCAAAGGPPSGTMCVHVYKTTDGNYYWFGPWKQCAVHNIPYYDYVTWVRSNQTGNVHTTYYDGSYGGGKVLGTTPAVYYGRPPGYAKADDARSIRVC